MLASPEILLNNNSHFWLVTVRNKSSAFCRQLACVAVDEAHLLWGWREFRQEYGNIGRLRMLFAHVPIIALSATITRNVLEYIRESLHLRAPVHLYKRTLDRPNIAYLVQEIKKPGYSELDILIPPHISALSIPKTMIFVDKIDEGINMAAYLRSLLDEPTQSRQSKLIQSFSSNNEASTRGRIMDDFANGDTRVLVCTDAAGMGVDIRDVACSIQWRIAEHLTLAALLQRVDRAGRDKDLPAVSIVFVEKKHMIRNVHGSPFLEYTTAIGPQD